MTDHDPQFEQIAERCVVDKAAFERWLDAKRMRWQALARGDYGITLEQAQIRFVCEYPHLFARAFLDDWDDEDPDGTRYPWEFWAYQRESIDNWFQDAVHQDGAEVGKTREIVVLVVWGSVTGFGFTTRNPSMLIGAPQQTHLDEIIMAVERHFGEGDEAEGPAPLINRFWRRPKKHPHYMHRFAGMAGRGRVYYRPAGHDGEAFRGVHVNAMAAMDEAAKIDNETCWSEFRRAKKPGCVERIYSVPDGRRDTEYFRICSIAQPGLKPGQPGYRLFHWPKTLMPAPFYTPDRERQWREMYGGKDMPGYIRNVLGEHGQPEDTVFAWETLAANIVNVPEYRALKLHVNAAKGVVDIEAYAVELHVNDGRKHSEHRIITDRQDDYGAFADGDQQGVRDAMYDLVSEHFAFPGDGVYWAGADLGFSKDPTEIRVWRELGHDLRCVLRLYLKGVGYNVQREAIYSVDRLYGFWPRWGVDFGNAGTAVVQDLQSMDAYADAHYEERLTGFTFSEKVDCVDEEGNILRDPDDDDKALRKPAKNYATEDLMQRRLQQRRFQQPYDQEVIGDYSNHTSREGTRHRIYAKTNDHVIDADRAMLLRKVFDGDVGAVDAFASGAHERAA